MTAIDLVAGFLVNLRGALEALNAAILERRRAFKPKRGRGQRRNRRNR